MAIQPKNGEALIRLSGVGKEYDTGALRVQALLDVELEVGRGEFLTVVGPSGSGKSTLLNIVGCLDVPTSGTYFLGGEEVSDFDADRLADVRNRRIGFVFQGFHLLPHLSAWDNVDLPLLFLGMGSTARRARVDHLLELVGLSDRARHRPAELSGGQMQRVAIARALACDPDLILADEPTGNLDTASGEDVLRVFDDLREAGRTLVVITHDSGIADRAERVVTLQDGRIVEDRRTTA